MSAIFGFTFDMGRMTEVLTPDIYRAHWLESKDDVLSERMYSLRLADE